jgi:hypothetical protein
MAKNAIHFRTAPCSLCMGKKTVPVTDRDAISRGADAAANTLLMVCPQCKGTGRGPILTK